MAFSRTLSQLSVCFALAGMLTGCKPSPSANPSTSATPPVDPAVKTALEFARLHAAQFPEAGQLLVVWNESPAAHEATLVAFEKQNGGFIPVYGPMAAGVGKNGFAAPGEKREGDGKSPTGAFALGQLFCYQAPPATSWPFTLTTADDKWVDDPESPDYNRHVRGETTARSYERLLLTTDTYAYCMVIEYNTQPVVKGHGSAIFFHLSQTPPGPTLGCVAIARTDMEQILGWLQPNQQPVILMGTAGVLGKKG